MTTLASVGRALLLVLYITIGRENFVVPNVVSICVGAEKFPSGLKVV